MKSIILWIGVGLVVIGFVAYRFFRRKRKVDSQIESSQSHASSVIAVANPERVPNEEVPLTDIRSTMAQTIQARHKEAAESIVASLDTIFNESMHRPSAYDTTFNATDGDLDELLK